MVAGLPTPRYPDSASYASLSFTAAHGRLFTVPLFYAALPTDPLRVGGQIVLAAIVWWVLAQTVASYTVDRRVSMGARLVILALGLCGPIASWNSTILSESVGISLTVLVFALWLRYWKDPALNRLIALLVAALLWMFTRPDNLLIGSIVIVCWTVWMLIRRGALQRLLIALVMCAISALGLVEASTIDSVKDVNLAEILAERILPNSGYTAWFVDHGMPYSPAIAHDAYAYPPTPLLDDAELGPWIRSQAGGVYAKFVLTHPVPQIYGWLADLSGEKPSLKEPPLPSILVQPNPSPSLLSPDANYGRHREVLPEVIQNLLFQQGQIGDVILLAIGAAGLTVVARRKTGRDARLVIPTLVVALALLQTGVIWLSAATELDRLGMMPAVATRIALWTIVACSLDRLVLLWWPRASAAADSD
jgi:hypothetical protein